MDWRQDDGLTDSWEMLVQKPDGNYAKLDWFGQSDRYGTPDWMHEGRHRWTTVLERFQVPLLDRQGRPGIHPAAEEAGQGPGAGRASTPSAA